MVGAERMSENTGDKHSPLVDIPNFIRATRDSGYRNTTTAFAEFVDNSLEAGATRIDIELRAEVDGEIAIEFLDNGCGMSPSQLASALQFGGSTRFSSRNGIGRFGMGLPNAAVSQARRVEVLSWRRPSAIWSAFLDVDDLTSSDPDAMGLAIPIKEKRWVPASASGTLVRLKKCDRLDTRELDLLTARLRAEFGRIFRDFLFEGKTIVVAGLKVRPSDPLFLRKGINPTGASLYGPPLHYRVKSALGEATVTVRFSELPIADWHTLSNEEKSRQGISKRAGVSILRGGREIDYGWLFMGSKRKENYDDWWRCEVNFPATLDEAFGVTNSKQRIRPTDSLTTCLVPDMERIARTLNSRARAAFASLRVDEEPRPLVRAEGKDHLLEPPRFVRNTASSGGFAHKSLRKRNGVVRGMRFQIEAGNVPDEALFTSSRERDRMIITLNAEHPFLKKYSGTSSGNFRTEDLHLLLLAAARSESCLTDSQSKKVVRAFLNSWGQTLSAYV
jgi:Histidine kinase-, DNA gyrase B-, and HSP90-like ATPase